MLFNCWEGNAWQMSVMCPTGFSSWPKGYCSMLEQYSVDDKKQICFLPSPLPQDVQRRKSKESPVCSYSRNRLKYGPFSTGSTLNLTNFHFGISKAEVPFASPASNFFHLWTSAFSAHRSPHVIVLITKFVLPYQCFQRWNLAWVPSSF